MISTVLGGGDTLVDEKDLIPVLMELSKGMQMLNNCSKLSFNYKGS